MGNCTSKKDEDVVQQSQHRSVPNLPKIESFATVYSRSSSKKLETTSKISLRSLSKMNIVKSSRRLLTNTTRTTSTSNLSVEQQELSSRRLLHITAKPVTALSNYERPVFYKSKSEKVSIDKVLEKLFIFNSLDKKDREHVFDAFEKVFVAKNKTIYKEGEVGDYFYVIEEGIVDITEQGSKVNSAREGACFGETALIYSSPRPQTCISRNTCTLWRLDQKTYHQLLANNAMENDNVKRKLLEKVSFLESVTNTDLQKIASLASLIKIPEGETIIRKGDEDNKDFYIIHKGHVKVVNIVSGGKKFDDQTLGPGEYFGEMAILRDQPRTADVIVSEDSVLLTISKEVFMTVMGPLKKLLIRANDLRRLKAMPHFTKADLNDSGYNSLMSHIKVQEIEEGAMILEEQKEVEGALYLVRCGSISITSSAQANRSKTISGGGYFGEHTMHLQSHKSRLSAVAQTKTVLGVISYRDIQIVLQSASHLQSGGSKKNTSIDRSIGLKDLKKIRILGVGTFANVWLVSHKKTNTPYALKIQNKKALLENDDVEAVKQEAKIMAAINHPFIVRLVSVYHDKTSVMMLLNFIQGGELLNVMTKTEDGIVPGKDTKFYTSCILEGLSHLHNRNIVYRDLKPENVMINSDGYLVIVDMGFAKVVKDKTFTLCGTPYYLAPEVLGGKGHSHACDYWSWAVLVHEMLSGITPFHAYRSDQMSLFKAIFQEKSTICETIDADARDLIERILVGKPSLRLGCLAGGVMDIKNHQWMQEIDFEKLVDKKINAPWVPEQKDALDSSEFNDWEEMKNVWNSAPLTREEQEQFKDFDNILD